MKEVLNVGYYSPGWPLSKYPNGIIAYLENILEGFDKSIAPVILTNNHSGNVSDETVIDISPFSPKELISDKLLNKALSRLAPSFVHTRQYRSFISRFSECILQAIQHSKLRLDILEIEESHGVGAALIERSKIPVVTRLHGPWFLMGTVLKLENDHNYQSRVFYEGEGIKNSHGVTSPSLDVLNQVRDFYNIELPDAVVIPNPVRPVSKENQWQYDANKRPNLLFVGRFDLQKGGDLMLQAFRLIAQSHHEVTLTFVGPDRGLTQEGRLVKFYEYIESEIPERAIRSRIQFLEHQTSEKIVQLRKASLITVFPSRYETFGISLVEGLAAGCPTVTTAVGGIKEIVTDGYNALLAVPDSAESIAEKTLALLSDEALMQSLSKSAIEDCQKRYYSEVVSSQLLDYYKNVLAT